MSMNVLIIVLIVAAAIAFVAWNRRGKGGDMGSGTSTPYASPVAGTGATTAATTSGATGPLASYDEYRRVSPSNMINGKLTCNRCGSNLLRTSSGVASCTTCGASLYRA